MGIPLEIKCPVVIQLLGFCIMHFKHWIGWAGEFFCVTILLLPGESSKKTINILLNIRTRAVLGCARQWTRVSSQKDWCECCQNQCSSSKRKQWNGEQKAISDTAFFFSLKSEQFSSFSYPDAICHEHLGEKKKGNSKIKTGLRKNIVNRVPTSCQSCRAMVK